MHYNCTLKSGMSNEVISREHIWVKHWYVENDMSPDEYKYKGSLTELLYINVIKQDIITATENVFQ